MLSQFIGEDWEGDNSNSIVMDDDDDDAEAREYVRWSCHMVPIVSLPVGFVDDACIISQADWKFGVESAA